MREVAPAIVERAPAAVVERPVVRGKLTSKQGTDGIDMLGKCSVKMI